MTKRSLRAVSLLVLRCSHLLMGTGDTHLIAISFMLMAVHKEIELHIDMMG